MHFNFIYESEPLLAQYLLFHYGEPQDVLPYRFGPHDALDFPVRCVRECLDGNLLPPQARALDVGCAVGRGSFELARHCESVTGIDASHKFIMAAIHVKKHGHIGINRTDEGVLATRCIGKLPEEIKRERVHFEVGDAHRLREDLGAFDVVCAANLIDRLAEPGQFLQQLPNLVKPGGQLILTSPYTWMEEFTPQDKWLGGREADGERILTCDALKVVLAPTFELHRTLDLPFLIREHARKYQWSAAQATVWVRH